MCAECGMNPCHPRCPNAPEPVPVHECVKCGYGILVGDKFWDPADALRRRRWIVKSGGGTYNIGFNGGDETQFDAQNLKELQECWSEFCKDEKISPGCVDYVERVS